MTLDLLRDDFEHALHTDPARAHTLPARFYLDPEVFEREKEAIFYRHWHYVGHLSQLERAGDYLTKRIADESIFVMRGAACVTRATRTRCLASTTAPSVSRRSGWSRSAASCSSTWTTTPNPSRR